MINSSIKTVERTATKQGILLQLEKQPANDGIYTGTFKNNKMLIYCLKDNASPRSPHQIKAIIPERYKTSPTDKLNNHNPLIKLIIKTNQKEIIC